MRLPYRWPLGTFPYGNCTHPHLRGLLGQEALQPGRVAGRPDHGGHRRRGARPVVGEFIAGIQRVRWVWQPSAPCWVEATVENM
eukprot:11181162-Lingulodinium_polyedra.AAC.1